jgi:GNAT superfamily N-acetyltransferase
MRIREAMPKDNDELQALQARCPMGTTIVVTNVNRPDFFARAKAYETYKVYVAVEDEQIIGSAACAVRDATINGEHSRAGYLFQAFVHPDYRRKGIASQLLEQREAYIRQEGATLAYTLILEGNVASMRYIESKGYVLNRTTLMPGMATFQEMAVPMQGTVRAIRADDVGAVAALLNETWQGYELYEPTSAEALGAFIERLPAYDHQNLLVLEERGEVVACMGYWDWSQVMQITVEALSARIRVILFMLDIMRLFRPMPPRFEPGTTLDQFMLTSIGYRVPKQLAPLVRTINNLAVQQGIGSVFSVCEQGHEMLSGMKGFIRIDNNIHVYAKPLRDGVTLGEGPIFLDGIDL